MQTTKVYQGYGAVPIYMDGGAMPPDPAMMGDPSSMAPAGPDPMAELQPMVEGYLSNPDPALADEIIMGLANMLGIAPSAAPPAPAGPAGMPPGMGGGDPSAGGMPPGMPGFKTGGKLNSILKSLQLK
jgi:hypothetical protein